eukprot:6180749-Pleurochrysis_carterae.AAC.3
MGSCASFDVGYGSPRGRICTFAVISAAGAAGRGALAALVRVRAIVDRGGGAGLAAAGQIQ